MPDNMTDDELRPLRPYIVDVIEKREVCVTRLVLAIDEANAEEEALDNNWADDVALIQELEKEYPVECDPCPQIDEGPEELDREQLAEILENEPSIGVAFGRWMDLHKPPAPAAADPSRLMTDLRYAMAQLRDGIANTEKEPLSAWTAQQLRDRMRRAADALERIDAAATAPATANDDACPNCDGDGIPSIPGCLDPCEKCNGTGRATPPADIFVTVEGGIVQCVDGIPPGVRVIVEDFDVDTDDMSDRVTVSRDGRDRCTRTTHEGKARQ